MVYGSAEAGDFFDNTAAEKAIFRVSGEENGFNLGGEGFVGVCHLQFHLKVGHGPQPPQEDLCLAHSGIGDG